MKVKTGIRISTVTLLFLMITASSLHAVPIKRSTVKIFTKGSKDNLPEIRLFMQKADLMVSRILPPKRSKLLDYSVVLLGKDEFKKAWVLSQGGNGLRFYLSDNLESWQHNDKILSNIIASIILKKSNVSNGENPAVIPAWITYAILKKIDRRQSKAMIPGTVSYPGIHALVLSGTTPYWMSLVTAKTPPNEPSAHEIYKEGSEIILDSIMRLPGGKEAMLDIIELANKGIKKEDLFQHVFTKKVSELESHIDFTKSKNGSHAVLEKWLEYNFRIASVNTFTPCSPTDAEKLFREAEIVSYQAKINDDDANEEKNVKTEPRFCKIEELPEKLDEIMDLKTVLIKKQRDLARIAFSIPIPLQESMYRIQTSLNLLFNAKDDETLKTTFHEKYLHSKEKFYQGLEKQNKIDAYIFKMEKTFVPTGFRFYAEINAMKEIKGKERAAWPALTELLDKNDTWHTKEEGQ